MQSIWNNVKQSIQKQIPGHSFRMWIEPLEFIQFRDNCMVIACANTFSKKRIIERYGALIKTEISNAAGHAWGFVLEINKRNRDMSPKQNKFQLPLPSENRCLLGGHFLRRHFTFDQFVVGSNNDFAYSASLSLASRNKGHQNCLFLLAKTGMGKSHLTQAVGHHILSQQASDRVYYITAEDFSNEMVFAFRHGSIDKFKNKYRTECDVLLLEDIHYLSGKDRTQVELALTLDTLFEANKKIIFSSCYPPSDIPKLNNELRSRLSCGLISNIDSPNFRTRVRILQKKAKLNGYNIPEDIISYLAGELTESVRQLESGLFGITAKSSLLGASINLRLAESVVKNISQRRRSITVDIIKKLVCKQYNISINDIVSRSRRQHIVWPRQIAMYLSRMHTDSPLQAIGKSFNRYHATALHSIAMVEQGLRKDSAVKQQVEFLCRKLESGDF